MKIDSARQEAKAENKYWFRIQGRTTTSSWISNEISNKTEISVPVQLNPLYGSQRTQTPNVVRHTEHFSVAKPQRTAIPFFNRGQFCSKWKFWRSEAAIKRRVLSTAIHRPHHSSVSYWRGQISFHSELAGKEEPGRMASAVVRETEIGSSTITPCSFINVCRSKRSRIDLIKAFLFLFLPLLKRSTRNLSSLWNVSSLLLLC